MKKSITTFALLLPALASVALQPVEQQAGRDLNPQFSNNLMSVVAKAADSSENQNSFFEGFESRDPDAYGSSANAFLPSGWSQFSRQGNKHLNSYTDGYWDLTWLTLSNEGCKSLPTGNQTTAYEGECYAYIMPDVMWGEKKPYPDLGLDYATNRPQDEWLVTPAITPKEEEWFYFKLQFRPGWALYSRENNDFSGETNLLEVYATEGDGTTDSEWTLLWSLKDYIKTNYTQQELRADLTNINSVPYQSIFIKVSDYVGKNVKLAFRFYGVNGQGMAIDNVSLGIPMPKPSYNLPSGFFTQQTIDPNVEEIEGEPQLLIPFGVEATWTNTSEDVLEYEWSYDGADGSKQTSSIKHLTTPAYEVGKTYTTPSLTGKFESRSAVYTSLFSKMQAGGRLSGSGKSGYTGKMGVATYNYLEPTAVFSQSSDYISFFNGVNDSWETLLGRMPNTIDILGFGTVYAATPSEYGFDYVDVIAQVTGGNNGKVSEDTELVLSVFRLPENEYDETATIIGMSILTGEDINALPLNGNYKTLRFNLEVPVVTDGNILVLMSPYNLDEKDKFVFPFLKSSDDKIWGTSVVYMMVYDTEENGGTYDTFYNLSAFPVSKGHFAGLTMSLGAAYSYMEAPGYNGSTIEIPASGGEYKLDIRAMFGPEEWVVTDNGVTKAKWIALNAEKDAAEADLYHTTLTFAANEEAEERDSEVYVTQAGSRVALKVVQAAGSSTAVSDIAVGNTMNVTVLGSTITVEGVSGEVSVYSTTGLKVAGATAEGAVSLDASSLAHGVYIVRSGDSAVKIVL